MPQSTKPAATGHAPYDDLRVRVRGLELALRIWNPNCQPTILALHGWLDNLASFGVLSPLLAGFRVVAVDLPGHGESGHRNQQGTYNIWDDLPDLLVLIELLERERVVLLGHSRGAGIASLLSAVVGPRVSGLVLLDGLAPQQRQPRQFTAQLRRFVHGYARTPAQDRSRKFISLDEAVAARCAFSAIDPRAARPIVARNLRPCSGGYRWRTDARLRLASAYKLSPANAANVLGEIETPGLLIRASEGLGRRLGAAMTRHYRGLRDVTVPGEHHCHLLEAAPEIAGHIQEFLEAEL